MLKYGNRLPTYQIKVDLCFVADTDAIHKALISDTKSGSIEVVYYSSKAIDVISDTKSLRNNSVIVH